VKLNKGLLFLFLELLTVLVQQPSGYSSALSPVLITLHNMMHLINMARHHQVQPAGSMMHTALTGQSQPSKATSHSAARQHNWHAASCGSGSGLGLLRLQLMNVEDAMAASSMGLHVGPVLPHWLNMAQRFLLLPTAGCHAGS
jgi:hypothetical protein